jgi:hypothetical protein
MNFKSATKASICLVLCVFSSVCLASPLASTPDTTKFKKLLDKVLTDHKEPNEPKLLIFPTIVYSPETSWEVVVSALRLYYAKKDTLNRLSELQSFNFLTFNKQYGSFFEHFVYTDKDKWVLLGKLKFQRFPLKYYGVGPLARKENEVQLNSDYISVRERIMHKISPNFFGGLQLDFQKVYNLSNDKPFAPGIRPRGIDGSKNLGLGVGFMYDSRHNALNVRNGLFGEITYLNYDQKRGSDYNFTSINTDFRYFKTVRRNQVLALQGVGQFINGTAPFNQLSMLGGENLMRGYYLGRYRDNNMVAGQVEYRFLPLPFSKRIGASVFLAAGTVAPTVKQINGNKVLPSGGFGLKYLLFPKKDIFLRFDLAFTKEGPGVYIFSGEAF